MSRIDDLITQYASDGVEYKALRDVGTWVGGITPSKAVARYWEDGTIPWVTSMDISATNGREVRGRVTQAALDETTLRLVPGPSVAVVMRSNILRRFLPIGYIAVGTTANQDLRLLTPRESIDARYVYWALQAASDKIRHTCVRTDGSMAAVDSKAFFDWRIPVPPLEAQAEIVAILDKFKALEDALEAELEARRTQRIALANNFAVASRDRAREQAQSERVTLGSLAQESVEPVKVEAKQSYVSLGVKWNGEGVLARDPRGGDAIKATTLYRARPGQLIYNRMFVVEGSFALVPHDCDGAVVSSEFPLFDLDTSRVEPFWLLQHLCDQYTLKRIEREVTGTERGSMKSRRRWKASQFANFEISLPSLEAQREIVDVIRSSDSLIQSLEDEIAARRKQCEHYRDRLLTFEELAT